VASCRSRPEQYSAVHVGPKANSIPSAKRSIVPCMTEAGRLIAIVDDDPSVLRALKRLLGAWSYRVVTYQSSGELLAKLPDDQPECLIVDLHMPEMSGLELTQRLTRSGIEIPTILITAYPEESEHARCKSAGAIALLGKPVQDDVLLAAIDVAWQQRRA